MIFRILIALRIIRPFYNLEGYMNRWWIIKYSKWFPWSVRLHRILRSDLDRHLHDHPWRSISIILKGGYHEVTPRFQSQHPDYDQYVRQMRWHGRGSIIVRRRATDRHTLKLPESTECWSLFFMGAYENDWGFYTTIGKIPRRRYYAMQAIEKWFADIAKARNDADFKRKLRINMTSVEFTEVLEQTSDAFKEVLEQTSDAFKEVLEQTSDAFKAATRKMQDITDYDMAEFFPQLRKPFFYQRGDRRRWIGPPSAHLHNIPKEQPVEKSVYYFGKLDSAGHHLRAVDGRTVWSPGRDETQGFPWSPELMDTGLLKNGKHLDIVDGRVFCTCGGEHELWIAFFWWDRSADSRPNSNSGFYVRGFEWEQRVAAFEFAMQAFPQVVSRQKFSLSLVP